MHQRFFALTFSSFLLAIPAQEATPPATEAPETGKVTEERLEKAYADARAACKDVLGAELDKLPPLKIAIVAELATVIADENLPVVAMREKDPEKAKAQATAIGEQIAPLTWAKYAWSTKTFFVVPHTWEQNADVLERPGLTADNALRAVMVHELCHALDDQKFDLGKCLLQATTADAATAFNAVLEGHAQLQARRVCKVRGWSDGFEAFTAAIGAIPRGAKDGEAMALLRRAMAAQLSTAYVDGERFAQAIVDARPKTGSADIFQSPPKDAASILQPAWYLDPTKRPRLLHDPEPAIDLFVAKFDKEVWSGTRTSPTATQLAAGLTLLPKADVDAVVASLRAIRIVQLVPTAAPQSKTAILAVMEFDSEESAKRWVTLSGVLSAKKDETMREGAIRIMSSKTTKLDEDPVHGLLQEKRMKVGRERVEMASIDAWRGRCVVETIYSGDSPVRQEHVQIVGEVLDAIAKKP